MVALFGRQVSECKFLYCTPPPSPSPSRHLPPPTKPSFCLLCQNSAWAKTRLSFGDIVALPSVGGGGGEDTPNNFMFAIWNKYFQPEELNSKRGAKVSPQRQKESPSQLSCKTQQPLSKHVPHSASRLSARDPRGGGVDCWWVRAGWLSRFDWQAGGITLAFVHWVYLYHDASDFNYLHIYSRRGIRTWSIGMFP